ncbi:Integration host factor subunit alpha [Serratia symbiotica]|nr:Integration host factor subunit alpha [Serratia symbiotica]
MTLTKAIISQYLFKTLKLSKQDAQNLVKLFFEEVCLALENGEKVKLSGFGNFNLKYKNQRSGRNPKTGQNISITERYIITFRPSKKLKNQIKNVNLKL